MDKFRMLGEIDSIEEQIGRLTGSNGLDKLDLMSILQQMTQVIRESIDYISNSTDPRNWSE